MKKLRLSLVAVMLLAIAALSSCVKKDFDAPPDMSAIDPNVPVNMTIARLKSMYPAATPSRIDSDYTIYGVVTADDRSGNWYKQINIQDSTGGITILVDQNGLYGDYPIGRKVYVKLKGLYMGTYGSLPQIGLTPDYTGALSNIPGNSIGNYIVKANYPNPIVADTFENLAALKAVNAQSSKYIQKLVVIKNVEVAQADLGRTYAQQAVLTSGTSVNIKDCAGNTIQMRTSGYANFQPIEVPRGNGMITAVYTRFNATAQLVIRDTTDLKFYGTRCDGTNPDNTQARVISLDSLRSMYQGTGIKLGAFKIKGTVISDPANGNPTGANIVIQDGNRGMVVYYGAVQSYAPGDSLLIDVTGDSLILYRGALELKVNGGGSTTTKVATGRTVTPQVKTIAEINANYSALEWTLVKVLNATVAGTGTYNGSKTLSDASGGTITLYTAGGASFAGQTVPSTPKNFTGIVSQFNTTKQLQMRNINDVQ